MLFQELSESQIEGLESGKLQLHELSLDQLGLGNQHGLTVSDGRITSFCLPFSETPELVYAISTNACFIKAINQKKTKTYKLYIYCNVLMDFVGRS